MQGEVYSNIEQFCLACGKVLIFIGGCGIGVSLLADKIMRGWTLPIDIHWFQWTGILASGLICLYGAYVDMFLNRDILPIVREALEK